MFKAYVTEQSEGKPHTTLQEIDQARLPDGDVLVAIAYSSLNYKDGLALTGKGKIARSFPMVFGIDFAGTVVESSNTAYNVGDQVLLTGWGVGERHWGGFAQYARVKAEWLVPLPVGLSLQQAMALGTAGFTAMLAVLTLEAHGLKPGEREVLVTGASGGVGSVAVALLARNGYNVTASTGKSHEYLQALGARQILERAAVVTPATKPLEAERWSGVVDTVGGDTLASVLRSTVVHGSVAACGNAGGVALNTTVLPFILRGINLLGIDSVMCPREQREIAWQRLAHDLSAATLDQMVEVIPFAELPARAAEIVEGKIQGRIVVDVNA